MIIGIVGSEESKFTKIGAFRAKETILRLIRKYKANGVSSGHCHLGGIDIWTENIAKEDYIYDPNLIFPPKSLTWSYGYKPRNIQIAKASNVVVCISVDKLPEEYEGMRFPNCYHCISHGLYTPHVKSGGCWTMWYAKSIGKITELIVIPNF